MASKNYETGIATRKLILARSRELFLEKGYRSTSFDDICRAAHVNRGSVYYHFKSKETIRYEVLWEIFTEYKKEAERFIASPPYQYLFALYLMWDQILHNPQTGRFLADYYTDYPVYTPNGDLALFISMIYRNGLAPLENTSEPEEFQMISVYGYLGSIVQLVKACPQKYSTKELFLNAMLSCCRLFAFSPEQSQLLIDTLESYID